VLQLDPAAGLRGEPGVAAVDDRVDALVVARRHAGAEHVVYAVPGHQGAKRVHVPLLESLVPLADERCVRMLSHADRHLSVIPAMYG
jgi:hypothetical protein